MKQHNLEYRNHCVDLFMFLTTCLFWLDTIPRSFQVIFLYELCSFTVHRKEQLVLYLTFGFLSPFYWFLLRVISFLRTLNQPDVIYLHIAENRKQANWIGKSMEYTIYAIKFGVFIQQSQGLGEFTFTTLRLFLLLFS